MQTGGSHSCLLNTKALELAGIDAAYAKEMDPDQIALANGYTATVDAGLEFLRRRISDWNHLQRTAGLQMAPSTAE